MADDDGGVKTFLERVSVWRVIRALATVFAIAAPIWAWAGSYVVTLADSAVVDILKRKGIDPESFQGMQIQLGEINKSIELIQAEKKKDVDESKKQYEEIIKLLKAPQQ